MTSDAEAEEIAAAWVLESTGRDDVVIDKSLTRSEDIGWVFFYNTRRFIVDRDLLAGLAGNAPIVVLRDTGQVIVTGTAKPVDHYLTEIRTSHR